MKSLPTEFQYLQSSAFYRNFSAKLLFIRHALALSQPKMAEWWGIPFTTYKNYEYGKRKPNANYFLLLIHNLSGGKSVWSIDTRNTIISYFIAQQDAEPIKEGSVEFNAFSRGYEGFLESTQNIDLGVVRNTTIPFIDVLGYDVEFIRYLRKEVIGLSRHNLSRIIGIKNTTVKNYERDVRLLGLPYLLALGWLSNDVIGFLSMLTFSGIEELDVYRSNEYTIADKYQKDVLALRQLAERFK